MGKALPPPNKTTHRAEYGAWNNMYHRCYSPACKAYERYGGRGITVARVWRGPEGFHAFVRDLGPRPSVRHSLDRIDVNKGYSANNCRWAPIDVQARNTRATRLITLHGETKCLRDWAAQYGLGPRTVSKRIDELGWDAERAFTTPAHVMDHARGGDPAYNALTNAIQRCHNPKAKQYANYGGRGVTVVPEWRGRGALARFKAVMGPHPGPGWSLDRIDVNKGYAPGNCRWATQVEQAENRRVTRWLTHAGETKTLRDWSRSSGVPMTTISRRIQKGWPLSRALALTELQRARKICENVACSPAGPGVD